MCNEHKRRFLPILSLLVAVCTQQARQDKKCKKITKTKTFPSLLLPISATRCHWKSSKVSGQIRKLPFWTILRPYDPTHDIRTIWKLIVINVPIVISWTFLVTPHSLRVLITIEWRIAVCHNQCYRHILNGFFDIFTHKLG